MSDELRSGEPPSCPTCNGTTFESDIPGTYICGDCGMGLDLDVTHHVEHDRWKERSDDPSYPIRSAWHDGLELPYEAKYEHNLICDEVRYHHETTTVLLRDKESIVTAIDYRTARYGIQRAVIKALLQHNVGARVLSEALQMTTIGEYEFSLISNEVDGSETATDAEQGQPVGLRPSRLNPVGVEQDG